MRPVLIALLAALVVACAAHAEPRFRDLGPVVAGPYTDGHRWAAWMPVRGKLTLYDTTKGHAWTQPGDPHRQPSLDAPGLFVHMCSPVKRAHADIEDELVDYPFIGVDYERPWALLPVEPPAAPGKATWLAQCGLTTKRRVCGELCRAHLSAGLPWRLPGADVVHTANRIFMTRWRSDVLRLLMAHLPR
jgi:hypothetical protein